MYPERLPRLMPSLRGSGTRLAPGPLSFPYGPQLHAGSRTALAGGVHRAIRSQPERQAPAEPGPGMPRLPRERPPGAVRFRFGGLPDVTDGPSGTDEPGRLPPPPLVGDAFRLWKTWPWAFSYLNQRTRAGLIFGCTMRGKRW